MKRKILCGIIMLIQTGCFEKEQDNLLSPLSLERNSIQMNAGDSWLYRRMFIIEGLDSSLQFPDTLVGYSYFQAIKDTVIDSKSYLIIEGSDYDIAKDTILILKRRSAVHLSDTILMYLFNSGAHGFTSGVLKASIPQCRLTISNFGTAALKRILLQKMSLTMGYDTTIYNDFVYPLIFPLIKDSIYIYRDTGDPKGNLPYRHKFVGIERVTIPLGQFEAYKFEWMTKEAFGIDSFFGYDWIGENGLLKRLWDCGSNMIYGPLSEPIDTCRSWEIIEKIGTIDIDPDTLIPWGKR